MQRAGEAAAAAVQSDAIFDDVLALNPPSALWPRPAAIGAPSRGRRGAATSARARRLECAAQEPLLTLSHVPRMGTSHASPEMRLAYPSCEAASWDTVEPRSDKHVEKSRG